MASVYAASWNAFPFKTQNQLKNDGYGEELLSRPLLAGLPVVLKCIRANDLQRSWPVGEGRLNELP